MIELPPPLKLREIAGRLLAADEGHTYRTRRGEPEYVSALQTMLAKVYRTVVPQEAVLATSGVTGALFASLQLANGRGVTKVGLTNPFYTYHGKHIELAIGNKPVFVQLDYKGDTFDFDWDSLEQQLKGGMGAIIVCNPGNPSGKVRQKRSEPAVDLGDKL
jgi:aspartate/methionine/tyrosine aminotransferase